MKLTSHLPVPDRERVEGRLHSNLTAWLTTLRPDGRPVTLSEGVSISAVI